MKVTAAKIAIIAVHHTTDREACIESLRGTNPSTEHNREHNSSPQSKHHTADFTARAEHGHTEQSLAHATVHYSMNTNTP